MKITLIAIGQRMPNWVNQAYDDYAKRLPRDYQLHIKALSGAKRVKTASVEQLKQQEAQQILAAIPAGDYIIALDERGSSWSTKQLAQQLQAWHDDSQDISLLVGGADGLASPCLKRADKIWSLSALTLPHPLVRVILAEQVYRAWSLLSNHPYHRA